MAMEMEGGRWDFLEWLGSDTSACVFLRLDDPSDLARAAAVSRSWRRFVIENDLCKGLCLRLCPEVASFACSVEVGMPSVAIEAESSSDVELRNHEKDHRIYSRLGGSLVSTEPSIDCIMHCFGASSTDNFPDESIENTLEPNDSIYGRPAYWSSAGHDDPEVPESLTYRLHYDLCVIDEIRIRPFQAYFQDDRPIYSSKSMRIRMGYSKFATGSKMYPWEEDESSLIDDDNYVWTYTSPEFPMLQENVLQSFKLPRPVLCIGGAVKIELLGRVQRQAIDNKFYICVCHVQVMGRSLQPVFMADLSDPAGYSVLKYWPDALSLYPEDAMQHDLGHDLFLPSLVDRDRKVKHLAMLNVLLGPAQFVEDDDVDGVSDADPFA